MLSYSIFAGRLKKALYFLFLIFPALLHSSVTNASVDITGVLEAELGLTDNDGTSTSDITQATLELGVDAEISEWVGGHVLFLFEEGEDSGDALLVDEAFIEVGNPFLSGFSLTLGQQYIPFGSFETNLVSDPLTLEIAETRESALVLTYESGFFISAYLFNGDMIETGGDDSLDNFGLNLGFAFEGESISLEIGFGYLNNMGETDGISGTISAVQQELDPDNFETATQTSYASGINAHVIFGWGMLTIIAELSAAMDEFAAGELHATEARKPSASNLELAIAATDSITVAVGVQNSVDADTIGIAESRFLLAASFGIDDATGLAIEYMTEDDYSVENGGTGTSSSTITVQFATEF